MAEQEDDVKSSDSKVIEFWHRIPTLIQSLILMFGVTLIGTLSWMALFTFVPVPWSLFIMVGVLFLFCLFFSGRWGHGLSKKTRRNYFRTVKMPPAKLAWGVGAAILFVIISQSTLVVTFRIIEFPAALFTLYSVQGLPLWIVWFGIIMASLVAGVCEEIGFRGYGQVPLEKRYGAKWSIMIVSIAFILLHLNQTWLPPLLIQGIFLAIFLGLLAYLTGSLIPSIIAHTVMDIFNFSFWWSDALGTFVERPIYVTGIDFSFIFWVSLLVISLTLFLLILLKLNTLRKRELENKPGMKK